VGFMTDTSQSAIPIQHEDSQPARILFSSDDYSNLRTCEQYAVWLTTSQQGSY